MLWVDYREKLGIGFSNTQKYKLLQSKVINLLQVIKYDIIYEGNSYFNFCMMTGRQYDQYHSSFEEIVEVLSDQDISFHEFIANYIAFVNTYSEVEGNDFGKREYFTNILVNMMRESKIGCEIQNNIDNNEYFIFPQGAQELDNALVSEPLGWLNDYPLARKTFVIALKQYSDGIYIRDVADNFRKSLEEFLKEFFVNSKNLANNIKEVGAFLKSNGGDSEITNILASIIVCYDKLNNKVAKHNDKVDAKFLEFLMYQTGLFIRMLIVVKRAEKGEAE